MNQIRRNKKNTNYAKNLTKRYNLTKNSDWLLWSENCIKQGNPKKMKHEFIQTKRNGVIQTREMYLFEWTKYARDVQKQLHSYPQTLKRRRNKRCFTKHELEMFNAYKAAA